MVNGCCLRVSGKANLLPRSPLRSSMRLRRTMRSVVRDWLDYIRFRCGRQASLTPGFGLRRLAHALVCKGRQTVALQ
jgi:hypothetical protein